MRQKTEGLIEQLQLTPQFSAYNYLIGCCQSLWDFLQSNPAQTIHSCHAALADSFPINFPDPAIVKLCTQPLVSSIDGIWELDLTCSVPDFKAIIHQ